ncbi:hypothetical protein EHS14_06335 [Schaalia georgiae]|nr:hypothetical protein EHS14_06335 [Schaalia georgiae]
MRFTVEMSAKPLGFSCSYDTTAQEITAVGRNIVITVAAITLSQIAVALVLRRVRAHGSRRGCESAEERSGNSGEGRGR